MAEVSIHSTLLWITAILIVSFDVIVFLGSRELSSRIFAVFSSFVAIWSISYGFLIISEAPSTSLFLIRLNHVIGIIISLGFVYFSLVYPKNQKLRMVIPLTLLSISIPFVVLFFFSDLMIPSMYKISPPDYWGWRTGSLYFIYSIIFNALWFLTLYNIYKHIKDLKIKEDILNQKYMFWGLTLGIIPPSILNIVLPTFGIYGFSWTGPIASAIWIFIIGYSIIRYRQMNVRVIITEMLAVAMTVIFFINIFIQTQFGVWEHIATFLVFLLLAIFLIRGVLVETKQKELLRDLNENLEQKVTEQTLEIRHSYDLERQARRELEKLNETKDQFIMITQHNLRTPLNNIQNNLDKLLTNVEDSQNEIIIKSVKTSINRLNKITNDFLSITAIKDGNNILNISRTDLMEIVENIIQELSFDLEQKKISVSYPKDKRFWLVLDIDKSKIHDSLFIIIENAIKYGIVGGKIEIKTEKKNNEFIISIIDNGIGISKQDQEKLFSKMFHRGSEAKKANPIGMGVGLSVARVVIQAHHGKLEIESKGENKGTIVTITFPW